MRVVNTIRNLVFSLIIAVCLFSWIGNRVAVDQGYAEYETESYLEGREFQTFPDLTSASFSEGTFQDEFEDYLCDHMPEHDDVILANAAMQRSIIALASLPFGFEAYETYFGSDYVYLPEYSAVLEMPMSTSDLTVESLNTYAEEYSALMEANPDIDWLVYICDRPSTTLANPAVVMSSDVADYEYIRENFLDLLPESCIVVDGSYTDSAEYCAEHYLTDHHWNIYGAIDAYEEIITALGKEAIDLSDVFVAYEGPFWGSEARSGLVLDEGDVVYDVEYERSSLRVAVGGKEYDASCLAESWQEGYTGHVNEEKFTDSYHACFHGDWGLIEIENLDMEDGETLLIIGDSYTDCFERFFAENYRCVYVIDPRHVDDLDIQEFIDENGIDDVAFIETAKNIDKLENVL